MMTCNEVYVTDVSIYKDPEVFRSFYDKMDSMRKEKIDRLHNDSDKYLSLGAGVLLKRAMSEFGIDEPEIELGANGKPYIKGRSDIFFNLSHSGTYAAMTVSDREVGIDIEKIKNFKDSLIKRVFDEKEIAMVSRLLSETEGTKENIAGTDALYTGLWTAKESVMKYFGTGLSMDPAKIHMELGKIRDNSSIKSMTVSSEKVDCSGITIQCYELEDYRISVCSEYDSCGQVVII